MQKLFALLLVFLLILSTFPALSEAVPIDQVEEPLTLEKVKGEIDGDVYENSFLGLGFRLPEKWRFYTEQEIRLTNELSGVILGGDGEELQAQNASIAVMAASAHVGYANLNLQILYLGPMLSLLRLLDAKSLAASQARTMQVALENSGMQDVEISQDTIVVDGWDCDCLRMSYSRMQMNLYATQLYLLQEECMVYVTATASSAEEADRALENLFWLE